MKNLTMTSSVVLALMLGAGSLMAAPADATTDPALEQLRAQEQNRVQNRERNQLNVKSDSEDLAASESGDQTRDRLRDGTGDKDQTRDRLHDGSGDGTGDGVPDQTRDRTQDRLQDGSGDGDPDQTRDRTRDRLDSEDGTGSGDMNRNRFENRRMNHTIDSGMRGSSGAGRR